MSEYCPICQALLSDRKRRRCHDTAQCSYVTERYAFNTIGKVGSLYDCWIDNIYESSLDTNFVLEDDKDTTLKCRVIIGDELDHDDLLEILGVKNESWLSIALNMCPVTKEMTKLYNYRLPDNGSVCFLFYHHTDRHTNLVEDVDDEVIKNILSATLTNPKVTHIVTGIQWGIDFTIALEYSSDKIPIEMYSILEKVSTYFTASETEFLSLEEQKKFNHFNPIIFSQITEICAFQDCQNVSEMCKCIHQYLFNQRVNIPVFYTLHLIKIPYSDDSLVGAKFYPLDSSNVQPIKKILLQLFNKIKVLEHLFDEIRSSSLSKHFQSYFDKAFNQFQQAKSMYEDIQSKLGKHILKLRKGTANCELDKMLKNLHNEVLNSELETLLDTVHGLKEKVHIISELETEYGLRYFNVADLEEEDDDQRTLETKLLSYQHEQPTHILCSSDKLMNGNKKEHKKLCQQLMDEQKTRPSLNIVFADFTYCKLILTDMKLFETNLQPSIPSVKTASSTESKELNVLLLGETGIGKSTFINAFVNYIAFKSIEKAEKNGPIILIPISFQMSNDDQSEEYDVNLGEQNNSEENFNHPGQTCTQHCQSYMFNLGNNTKLRIIDTPGIGDTRGLSQNDKNIQYILSYVSNLSHLNAVCILLKPNVSRLNILFRSCLEQIFNFLGPNAHDNIIFCFTSSRSTFFLPGNTGPLLKKMLNDFPEDHAPQLSKENLFYFDSESFRYLATIKSQVNVSFNDDQKTIFITTWDKSVSESIRWLDSIKSRPNYQMNTWHSIKHAQIIITSLIRPILETIRHILRNKILSNTNNKQDSIEFQVESVSLPSYLCTTYPFKTIEINTFPMVDHSSYQYGKGDECQCEYNKHLPIFYQLKYNSNPRQNHQFDSEVSDCLIQGSVIFTHFFLNTSQTNEDPFLPWLNLFIQEELFLCSQQSSINKELYTQLIELKTDYENQLHKIKRKQEQINLDEIYQWIEKIEKIPMINQQTNAIKKSQLEMMQHHEHHHAYPDIDNSEIF